MLVKIILLRLLAAGVAKCPEYIDILDDRLAFDSVSQSYRKVQNFQRPAEKSTKL